MFIEVVTSALMERAWHERATIVQFTKDFLTAARAGQFKCFAFGPGGVGKTTLGKLLSGEYTLENVPPDYDLSLEREEFGVEGRYFVGLNVPPGQEEKRGYHWDQLYREISGARRYAIINVVSWGYHSLGKIEMSQHKLFRPGMSPEQFLSVFLDDRKAAEIALLREMLPHLKSTPGNLRMLTVVTKQDLWWSERNAVKNYYEDGEYNQLIEDLRRHKGSANFSHDYVSASLNLLNFRTADGVVLTNTIAGYDSALWSVNFNSMINHIRGLIR